MTGSKRKPSPRQQEVVNLLRREIIEGKFKAEEKLPIQAELIEKYGVSQNTITRAIQRLKEEGFILAKPRVGMMVAKNPPHLDTIVVAIPDVHRFDLPWPRYFTAAITAASRLTREFGRLIRVIDGVDDLRSDGHAELTELVCSQRVAGVLFVTPPFKIVNTAILTTPHIPRIAVCGQKVPFSGIDATLQIGTGFHEKSLDYLKSQRRRKIAIIANPTGKTSMADWIQPHIQERGMMCPPHWRITLGLDHPDALQNIVRLLVHPGQPERPDALIIANDNLVDDAVVGLIAEKISIPEDMEVIAHCNFPWPPIKFVSVRRLGPNVEEIFRVAIGYIDRLRQGLSVPHDIQIPAVWEDEILLDASKI